MDFNNHEKEGAPLKLNTYGDLKNALAWLGIGRATAQTAYGGKVASGGTAGTPFPSGWTVSLPGTGRYLITHNLNTTNYVVAVTNVSAFSNVGAITNHGSNSFEVTYYENTVGATWPNTNTAFMFTLILQ